MAIDYAKAGNRLTYLAKLEGSKNTMYLCSAEGFQSGWTDTDGNWYNPRMSGLVIDHDLGGLALPKSSVGTWRATFNLTVRGYSEAEWWTTFLNANRLETSELTIWLIDPDGGHDGDREYIFRGFIQPGKIKIGSGGTKQKLKAIGGPAKWNRAIAGQNFESADFESGDTVTYTFGIQDESRIGYAKNWWFNCKGVLQGCVFQEGYSATPIFPDFTSNGAARGICFGWRLGDDETFIGNSSWTHETSVDLKGVVPGTGTNPFTDINLGKSVTSNSTRSEYSEGSNPLRHLGYVELDFDSSTRALIQMHTSYDAEKFQVWIDYPTNSTITDEDDIVDWILFQTANHAGYLGLGTGAQGSTWSTYASEAYPIDLAVPGTNLQIGWPKLTDVLREIMWYSGHDLWLSLDSTGAWQVDVERRSFTSADATTLGAHDIVEDSLVYMIDPKRDYCNTLNGVGAIRWSTTVYTTTPSEPPEERRQSTSIFTSSETVAGIEAISKSVEFSYLVGNTPAQLTAVFTDRAADLAQAQIWFEFKTGLRHHGLNLHDVIDFAVGNFPTTPAQIRKKRVDYDRGTITFEACTVVGQYTA